MARGKLQLWLVEDSITAMQLMPDGSPNKDYVHMHVFRDAINGTWGQDLTAVNAMGWNPVVSYQYTLNESWNRKHLWLIAFVYDDSGVLQVIRKHL